MPKATACWRPPSPASPICWLQDGFIAAVIGAGTCLVLVALMRTKAFALLTVFPDGTSALDVAQTVGFGPERSKKLYLSMRVD